MDMLEKLARASRLKIVGDVNSDGERFFIFLFFIGTYLSRIFEIFNFSFTYKEYLLFLIFHIFRSSKKLYSKFE